MTEAEKRALKREQKLKAEKQQQAASSDPTGKKNIELDSREQEINITEELFAADIETVGSGLKTEPNYVQFAKQVAGILYEG